MANMILAMGIGGVIGAIVSKSKFVGFVMGVFIAAIIVELTSGASLPI